MCAVTNACNTCYVSACLPMQSAAEEHFKKIPEAYDTLSDPAIGVPFCECIDKPTDSRLCLHIPACSLWLRSISRRSRRRTTR
jgi:hypothetical protein